MYKYLLNKEGRTPILYLLPKIHKGITPSPCRPIISAVSSNTEKISKFVDHFPNPCAQKVRSYLRDTTHFLTTLEDIHDLPADTWLVMAHVVSLYMTIPNASSIHAAKKALHDLRPNPNVKPSKYSIIQLFEFVLTKNNF